MFMSAPKQMKAWVSFNGLGVVAIRASENVSSITDVGVGDYLINFANKLPDANYSVTGMARRGSNFLDANVSLGGNVDVYSDSQFHVDVYNNSTSPVNVDPDICNLHVMGA